MRDLDATIQQYVDEYGIGPWARHDELTSENARDLRVYGQPVPLWRVAAASARVGQVMWDLIAERPFPADNPDRMLRNAFIDRWNGREFEIPAQREALQAEVAAGHERADLAVAGVSAGVSAGLITAARPAGEIVRGIVQEAEDLLRERPRMLLG